MADNMQIVCKLGETHVVFSVVLKDTDPATGALRPTDLTNWTDATMTVKRTDGTLIFDKHSCSIDADQVLNRGKITSIDIDIKKIFWPELVTGRHLVEFAVTNPAGGVRFFPMSDDDVKTYGEFIVQESL